MRIDRWQKAESPKHSARTRPLRRSQLFLTAESISARDESSPPPSLPPPLSHPAFFCTDTETVLEESGALDFAMRPPPSLSLLREESRFTAFYTAIVFAERRNVITCLKSFSTLARPLQRISMLARGECLAFQALHSAEILRLSYRVQGCREERATSMSFTRCAFGSSDWFSRTK